MWAPGGWDGEAPPRGAAGAGAEGEGCALPIDFSGFFGNAQQAGSFASGAEERKIAGDALLEDEAGVKGLTRGGQEPPLQGAVESEPESEPPASPIDFSAFFIPIRTEEEDEEEEDDDAGGPGASQSAVRPLFSALVTRAESSTKQIRVDVATCVEKGIGRLSSLRQDVVLLFNKLQAEDEEGRGTAPLEAEDRSTAPCNAAQPLRQLQLHVPVPLYKAVWRQWQQAVNAWVQVAAKSLASVADGGISLVSGLPLLPLTQVVRAAVARAGASGASLGAGLLRAPGDGLALKLAGFGDWKVLEQQLGTHLGWKSVSSSIGGEAKILEQQLRTHVGVFSLTSAVMFIASIRGLNQHSTARQGNVMGMLATALAILSIVVSPGFNGAHARFLATFLTAGLIGYQAASQVKMEDMPQLVAGFHSFVGLAAVFAGFASYLHPEPFNFLKAVETFIGTAVGMLTFTGSVVAAGKLHGVIPGRPIILDYRWLLNVGGAAATVVLGTLFTQPQFFGSLAGTFFLAANTAVWGFLGANMVLPIGGADMPVVVSLLNAFSGLATSAAGFMLSNNLLTITGALVASSGTLLSDIMCRGINRSMTNVLLGGFGTDDGGAAAGKGAAGAPAGNVTEVSPMGFVGMLLNARRVVIVPGYGLAVARCQQRLAEIVEILRSHGVVVHFGIHPVAGRLPGHMNVLLAEADVPYDIVKEMDEVNAELPQIDVAIVVGANDIVNPATQSDPTSPIHGMPAVRVWECKTCIVLKRSMATGYSGVDNPLFYRENVRMLFGDAKHTMDTIKVLLEESQDRIAGLGSPSEAAAEAPGSPAAAQVVYPEACKVVGVIRERRPHERRVSLTPAAVLALRKMSFSVLLEAGAGVGAGFSDEDFLACGGVQVAESADEVLKQADVILKVNEPLLDEVQMLQGSQTMVGFWSMYNSEQLTEALRQSMASFVNMALIPRVSRAQKLDALTSMANIAGYRAALDAFNRLPRFSRSSITACGAVPPAKVFVIGAAVAGLSAIATAHSLGAKVLANDVRSAAREQVESLGAQFVEIKVEGGIAGEGVGGYATTMSEEFSAAQLATYAGVVPDVDIVICTAQIPNRAAPQLLTEEMVASMRRGSVIVDLAASAGGNCALTKADQTIVTEGGVTIIGETNYPASMPGQSSEMFASNCVALLETLGGATDYGGEHWEDTVIRPAMVMHEGKYLWPPPPPPQPAASSSAASPPQAAVPAAMPRVQPPQEASQLLEFLEKHKHEIAMSLGAAVVLGLGFGAEIPEAELTHIGYFVLSLLIGHFTVAGVTPALHTPLISVTNAISGIIVIGGMLQLSGPLISARVGCALAAVFLSSINIVGGFAVTHRMLQMFREDQKR